MDVSISCEELQVVSDLTVQLVELRRKECKHLSVEHVAPDIFNRLLSALAASKQGISVDKRFSMPDVPTPAGPISG
jgi:hypothetical protein